MVALLLAAIGTTPLAGQPATRRWVVDNAATALGDGSTRAPFNNIAAALGVAGAGDTIVVRAGARPYQGGFSLASGVSLTGEGGMPVIAADGDVVRIAGTTSDVTLANVTLRAGGRGAGVVVENTRGAVTLRDVMVTTAGGAGVAVKKAAKLVVAGTSAVAAVDGPAVVIEETALDAVFSSLSARGRMPNGIVLRKTTGRFTVAGKDGQRGSGGVIDGATERAISVAGASNVAFRWMTLTRGARVNGVASTECGNNLVASTNQRCNAAVHLAGVDGAVLDGVVVDGSAQAGIVAHDVKGLSLLNSEIRNAGDELFEHGLLLQELRGDCRIVNTKVERSASRHLMLHNSGGALVLTIERSTFADSSAPHGQQSVLVSAAKDAGIDFRVRGATFARSASHALDVTATDQAKVAVSVTGSTFDGNASAVSISATGRAAVQYTIADNPSIAGSSGSAINIYLGQPSLGTMSGTIARNTIGRSGVPMSGAGCASCSGIALTAAGNGMFTAEVTGNVIQQVGGSGVSASAGGGAQMRLTITSNLFRQPGGSSAPAIRAGAGTAAADVAEVCADIGGAGANANTIEDVWQADGAIHLLHRFGATRFRLAGLAAGERSDTAAAATVGARNRAAKVRAVLRPESRERGFEPADLCTIRRLTP